MYSFITENDIFNIKQVVGGADITGYKIAKELRSLESRQKEAGIDLIVVTSAMGDYDVTESLPYFGCIATQDGIRLVNDYFGEQNG